jgi:hypothetical protein
LFQFIQRTIFAERPPLYFTAGFQVKHITMKKIILLPVVIAAIGFSSLAIKKTVHRLPLASAVPSTLSTANNFHWSASVSNAAGYKQTSPTAAPVITQARFKPDGSFDFVFSKINTLEQVQTETEVEGKVLFTQTETGKNSFVVTAEKGTCRQTKNGLLTECAVPLSELKANYSGAWLWEKITFADIPSEDFLLLVDLKAHPAAANKKPGSIDKSWVSKFYLRK